MGMRFSAWKPARTFALLGTLSLAHRVHAVTLVARDVSPRIALGLRVSEKAAQKWPPRGLKVGIPELHEMFDVASN